MVLIFLLIIPFLIPAVAHAERQTTAEAFLRFEEILRDQVESKTINNSDTLPALIVRALPSFEESRSSFVNRTIASLQGALGGTGIRYCDGCSVNYSKVRDNGLEIISPDSISLNDISDFDTSMRGNSPPAQTGWWFAETPEGISVRGVSLVTGKIVFAQNISPSLESQARTQKNFTATRDLLRRHRGDSLTHSIFDVVAYPSQHLAIDWLEQWGTHNQRFFGLSASIIDPILGIGASYAEAYPDLMNGMLGGKILMSVPTALIKTLTKNFGGSSPGGIDPLLTLVGIARIPLPFFDGNYALNTYLSSNGKLGFGISTLNSSFLPVLP